eukprot:SAG11_NODE_263_length_11526_cov_23.830314_1_plen_73_part_00
MHTDERWRRNRKGRHEGDTGQHNNKRNESWTFGHSALFRIYLYVIIVVHVLISNIKLYLCVNNNNNIMYNII